jgi:hypothetical protein
VRERQHAGARGAVGGLDLELEQRSPSGSIETVPAVVERRVH